MKRLLLALLLLAGLVAPAAANTSYSTTPPIQGVPTTYTPGKYYLMYPGLAPAAGTVGTANTMYCIPFNITKTVTVGEVDVRVATNVASSNFQVLFYANDPFNGKPTSTPVIQTGNISGATAGNIGSTITNYQFQPGTYWECNNSDSALAFSVPSGSSVMNALTGAGSLAMLFSSNTSSSNGLSTPATFGTGPDLTSATFTENATNVGKAALIGFRVISQP